MAGSIYITATDTDIGKTFVSGVLAYLLKKKHINSCYYKPVSSGGVKRGGRVISQDTEFVKQFLKTEVDCNTINSYSFEMPASPHLASAVEGEKIDFDVILENYYYIMKQYDAVIVEGCGGIAVPFTKDGQMQAELIKKMNIPCVLVSRTTLGTINHTLTALSYAEKVGVDIRGIIFNGYRKNLIEDDSIDTIKNLTGLKILGIIPCFDDFQYREDEISKLSSCFDKLINTEEVINLREILTILNI